MNSLFPILKKVARSFYLTIRLLPKKLQEPVALAYLLARASDTIADEVTASFRRSECDLLKLLPSLLETLNNPSRDPIEAKAIRVVWQRILEGQQWDVEKFSPCRSSTILSLARIFHTDSAAACEHLMDTASTSNYSSGSMKHTAVVAIHHLPCLHQNSRRLATNQYEICGLEELSRYLYLVAGCVGEFWTTLAAHHRPGFSKESFEKMRIWAIDYGKGLQLTNILRDRYEDRENGRFYCSEDQFSQLQEQALDYLQQGRRYIEALRPGRFKMASALPLMLAVKTLSLVDRNRNATKVKVGRCSLYLTLLQSSIFLLR